MTTVLDQVVSAHTLDLVEESHVLSATVTVLPGQAGTWVALTQAAYDALAPDWDPAVLYLIIN